MMDSQYKLVIDNAREAFESGITKDIEFRKDELKKLYRLLTENEQEFVKALHSDLRKPRFETMMTEVDFVLNDIRSALSNLDSWIKPKFVSKSLVTLVDDNYIHYEPYGLVLVIGAWNYPIQLALSPLVGAIAAGNACIVKPSEVAPATARLLHKLLPTYLNSNAYQCILGDGNCVQSLLSSDCIDYVFYTGSNHVGKLIYQSASQNLIPCTLELGGKSPVYIDQESYLNTKSGQFNDKLFETTVRRILWGKFLNSGQTCVAPDYVLCTRYIQTKFMTVAKKIIHQFYGDCPAKNTDYGRIVSSRHFNRLSGLLTEQLDRQQHQIDFVGSSSVLGGEMSADQNKDGDYYVEPTVIACSGYDEPIMKSEIFGPILPLVPVNEVKDAINFINSRDKPLSLYIFSTDKEVIKQFQHQTSSGSVCVNDTVLHLVAEALPFGGVGKSGMGAYHGKHSFKTFSHQKSMLVRGFNPIIEWVAKKRYPPYSENHLKRMLRLLKRRPNPLPISAKELIYLFWFMVGVLVAYLYMTMSAEYPHRI